MLGKAVTLLPAAEMLQEAISSPGDRLGLSRLDCQAPSSVIICSFAGRLRAERHTSTPSDVTVLTLPPQNGGDASRP